MVRSLAGVAEHEQDASARKKKTFSVRTHELRNGNRSLIKIDRTSGAPITEKGEVNSLGPIGVYSCFILTFLERRLDNFSRAASGRRLTGTSLLSADRLGFIQCRKLNSEQL